MTVIAWDGRTLAADKRVCSGYSVVAMTNKIFRNGRDELLAIAGSAAHSMALLDWYRKGADRESFPAVAPDDRGRLLVIDRGGRIREYEGTPDPQYHQTLYGGFALGSGSTEAMVAMYCGKSAREAVEIACLFDISCGNGIDTLTFED